MKNFTKLFHILSLMIVGSFFSTTIFAANIYWIGGTGNYSDVAHWSSTSGGASCTCTPSASDNVIFDANSFSGNAQTVTIDASASFNSMDWSAITQTSIQMSGSSDLHINGSLIMKNTMVLTNYTGALYFESINTGNTITSAGKSFTGAVYFNGNGGEWTLQDAFYTTGDITLNYGTLLTNNKNFTCNTFSSNNSNVRGLTLGASTVTLSGYWTAWNTGGNNFAFDAGTSLIKFTTATGWVYLSAGLNDGFYDVLFQNASISGVALTGGLAFHNVTFPAVPSTINANNGTSFHKVIFNGDGTLNNNAIYDSLLFATGHTYTLEYNKIQTINNYLKADGNCTQPIILQSNTAGTQATISQAAGSTTINYVQMQDISATGGATFTANFTSDISDNSGWTMATATPADLYWIGGVGNWNSPSHWSATSNGSAACIIPTASTNVHFDANSFSTNGQTVTINVTASCNSMDWSPLTKTSIQMSGTSDVHINGSLTMKSTMVLTNYTGALYFESTNTGNTITSSTKTFTSAVYFNGNFGEWTLQDAFSTTGDITLNYGTLFTNNKNFTANTFSSNNNNIRGLTLGISTVTLSGNWTAWNTGTGGNNFAFDAGTSLIKFTTATGWVYLSAGLNDGFYDVLFQNASIAGGAVNGGLAFHNVTFPAVPATISANNGTSFHEVIFNGDGILNNNAIYDNLLFAAGHTYTLQSGFTQSINNYFQADGTCTQPIILNSSSAGTQAIINSAASAVTINYAQMQDISAIGGAIFIANNTTNNGNNTGWSINTATPVVAGYTDSQSGLSTTFINTSTGATFYKWIFGDGSTSTLTSPIHTYNLGGNYNVCLIASNSCGVNDTICKSVNAGCYPPVANYAASVNGMNVSFANSSTNAASVLWKFGDATSSTTLNPNHTYFNSGTYTVCLIVSNGCGKDSICQNVTVTCAPPIASYYYSVNGMTVNFTNVSSNAATTNWTFGDSQSSTQNSPSHTYNSAGTYSVKLKITNGCGKDSLTQTITVVCSAPMANFITNPQGLKVDFVSTSSDATSVSWDFGDGATSILPFVNHAYTTTNTYTVCLTAHNGCGTDTYCMPVSVCASPIANFTKISSALNVSFTNTSTNGINYYWNFGDAHASNSVSPTHIYSSPGTYKVCLVSSNSCGTDTICNNINVLCTTITNQSICMVTVDTLSTHNIIYWGKPVVTSIDSFRIYREVTTNNYAYIASVAYDSLSEYHDHGANPNVTSYKYKLTLKDSCGSESALSDFHNTIHLQNLGNGNLQWTLYGIENAGNPVTYYRIYRDDINNGIFLPISSTIPGGNSTYTDINYNSFPNANYRVDVAWSISCSPTRASVNTSRSNIKHQSLATGIPTNDASFPVVVIYPNPANESITIELGQQIGTTTLKIMNVLGQLMENEILLPASSTKITKQINVSEYAKGVYTVSIENSGKKVFKKLVVN